MSEMALPHVLLFPFMAKGHMTPLLHLASMLRRRGAAVTIVTTPGNHAFVSSCLSDDTTVSIIDIPFPRHVEGVPVGVESTDELPEISLWVNLAMATKLMQPAFEQALEPLSSISFMITDFFLGWTLGSAKKYGIPRLAFCPMGTIPLCLSRLVAEGQFSEDREGIKIQGFPWVKLVREDFQTVFIDREATKGTRVHDFTYEQGVPTKSSYGIVVNTFYEMESQFVDFWDSEIGPPVWCLGPLSPPERKELGQANRRTPWWISWLDQIKAERKPVLYVAFGTQVEISAAQFREIQAGLEQSGANFLWLVRKNESDLEQGFEDRVRGRGIVVKEWVDQREILDHESVQGFLCHCGWSSLMESVCAKVPILAWPMMWEQPLNAKAAELAGVALRVERTSNGFVTRETLAKAVKELMEGDAGKEVRKKAEEVGGVALKAVEEGGSSWKALSRLLSEWQQPA